MEFRPLFTDSLDGWDVVDSAHDNFRLVDGILHVEAPEGWLRYNTRYRNFELNVEFRFLTDDADSGIFVRAAGTGPFTRGWPNESYQIQLLNPIAQSPFPPVGGIFRHGMPSGDTEFDESLAASLSRPTGEWQSLGVRVEGTEIRVELNGALLTTAHDIVDRDGFIGLQGETGALEFRRFDLREL
jgi:hypothetical protein